jgi:hypothetical protein
VAAKGSGFLFLMVAEGLAHETIEAKESAFHAFGGEIDFRESGDGTRAEAAAVIQPKDTTAAGEFGGRDAFGEAAVDLLKKDELFDIGGTGPGTIGVRHGLLFVDAGINVAAAAFRSVGRFKVIVDDVGGDNFQEAKNGIGMVGAKVFEQAALVGAELEVSFLDKIVKQRRGGLSPNASGAQGDGGDELVKTADKLGPSVVVPTFQARHD